MPLGLDGLRKNIFNNNGNIVAIVGGMEDEGSRAVKDDKDYIYEIKENAWYGWPDYSGGDPINSPRFSDNENKLEAVISNPPTKHLMDQLINIIIYLL